MIAACINNDCWVAGELHPQPYLLGSSAITEFEGDAVIPEYNFIKENFSFLYRIHVYCVRFFVFLQNNFPLCKGIYWYPESYFILYNIAVFLQNERLFCKNSIFYTQPKVILDNFTHFIQNSGRFCNRPCSLSF